MKHGVLRSIAHNIADSFACGFAAGGYTGAYVYGEIETTGQSVTVDFLKGTTSGGRISTGTKRAVQACTEALPDLCAKHRALVTDFTELTATYYRTPLGPRFIVTVADHSGRRSRTEYQGWASSRIRVLDGLGRIRRTPIFNFRE
jgi:hypothetical protein